MLEERTDLWEVEADVRAVTTNGSIIQSGVDKGSNVMGGGCALEARNMFPDLPMQYGEMIQAHGNHVFLLGDLIMFPVKHLVTQRADIDLVMRSAEELVSLANIYGWERVALPRPGCGLGGLDWEEVSEQLHPILDDRFIAIHYPK